jgi:hypothetical protein
MTEYNDDLFLAPKTTQYGSHMVMTNVSKPTKKKYINIDTKFRDEYNYLQVTDYNITLPERITDVKNMTVTSMEIPMTFYNISSSLGNNSFQITDLSNSNSVYLVVVPDGNYNQANLITTLNTKLNSFTSNNLKIDLSGNNSRLYSNGRTFSIDFTVNDQGIPDKYNFRYKLGWLLGFRNPYYTIIGTNIYTHSEQFIDLTNPRYLYLALEEFNNGNQKSFVSPITYQLKLISS